MCRGKVKWFNKNYGFILYEDKDIFFHFSVIEHEGYKTIDKDVEVEFEYIKTDKGLQATKVIELVKINS